MFTSYKCIACKKEKNVLLEEWDIDKDYFCNQICQIKEYGIIGYLVLKAILLFTIIMGVLLVIILFAGLNSLSVHGLLFIIAIVLLALILG